MLQLFLLIIAIATAQQQPSAECGNPNDVRICPDGSIVDRDPKSNCNFKPCPNDDDVHVDNDDDTDSSVGSSAPYSLSAPVTGTFKSVTGLLRQHGTITGDFFPHHFAVVDELLTVTGTLRAVLVFRQILRPIETPINLIVQLADPFGNTGRRRLLQVDNETSSSLPTVTVWTTATEATTQPPTTEAPTTTTEAPNTTTATTQAPTMTPTPTPTQAPVVCQILHLNISGVTELDLLGLMVRLNPVLLDITADPLGGILGALLCAIGGLLTGLGPLGGILAGASELTQIANLLNSVLGLLNLANQTENLGGLGAVTDVLNSLLGVLNLGS